MAKDGPSSTLSPFRRFEAFGKALFAVPKKAIDKAAEPPQRKRTKRKRSKKGA
jgi:hypothetical protein